MKMDNLKADILTEKEFLLILVDIEMPVMEKNSPLEEGSVQFASEM
jgi:CheY-like chemotaxis protein